MPPRWSTSPDVTLSSTGAWGTCRHCAPPSTTPNGSTVNKAANCLVLTCVSVWRYHILPISALMCLLEPHFVSVYEIGRFAYFFLRETAVENDCGKMVFSRVARVCKNDMGGRFLLEDTWTTFMKARLNCSRSGEIPFYYNELQSTFYLPEQELIFGIFTTNVWVMLINSMVKHPIQTHPEQMKHELADVALEVPHHLWENWLYQSIRATI